MVGCATSDGMLPRLRSDASDAEKVRRTYRQAASLLIEQATRRQHPGLSLCCRLATQLTPGNNRRLDTMTGFNWFQRCLSTIFITSHRQVESKLHLRASPRSWRYGGSLHQRSPCRSADLGISILPAAQ
jgi:hypothetical protein